MLRHCLAALVTLTATPVAAGTVAIDLGALPSRTVYGTAELTVLARDADQAPSVVLLAVEAGREVPPHATEEGLRLLTVLEGTLFWGDGDTVDPAAETVYPAGSILMVPAGVEHWLAARDGDLLLQLVTLDANAPAPAVREQMR